MNVGLATVPRLMIDKRDGKVAYAVLSFGGFLGFGGPMAPAGSLLLQHDLAFPADQRLRLADDYTAGRL